MVITGAWSQINHDPLIRGLGDIAGNFKGGVTDFVALVFAAFRPVDQIGRIRRWIEILYYPVELMVQTV